MLASAKNAAVHVHTDLRFCHWPAYEFRPHCCFTTYLRLGLARIVPALSRIAFHRPDRSTGTVPRLSALPPERASTVHSTLSSAASSLQIDEVVRLHWVLSFE